MAQAQNPNPGSESANNKQNGPVPVIETPETPETPAAGARKAADPASHELPRTEIVPESAAVPDPILDPGPLPDKPMSLIGGSVKKVDAIRNRVLIQPFGGGPEAAILFDDRSHIYRNGAATTVLGIHRGDRVYVDTMTLEHKVFARTIRVETATGPVEAHGQVVHFNASNHEVQMRESLTSQVVSFSISERTALHKKNGVATTADFVPGALIEAVFAPGRKGGIANDVNILAVPGSSYVLVGRITNVDVRRGLLAVENESDQRNYELRYNAAQVPGHDRLRVGAKVTAQANFDGKSYLVDSISILEPAPDNSKAER
jgi:hypothetical protein